MFDRKNLANAYYAGMSEQELQAILRMTNSYAPHIVELVASELESRGIAPALPIGLSPRPKPSLTALAGLHWGLLRAVRSFRHWRARLFHGRPPEWATELTGVVAYVNFLQLLPTLSAIAFVPERFARRIPSMVDRKHHLYLGPIKYVSTWISFVIAFSVAIGVGGASRLTVSILVLFISLFSPLWITAYLAFAQFWIFMFQRFEKCKDVLLPVVFRMSTYSALSGRLLLWQLLYFGGYLSLAVMVSCVAVYAAFWLVTFVFGADSLALRLAAWSMGLVAVWGTAILIMPQWIAVLRNAVRCPTPEMIRMDLREIAEIAYALLKREEVGDRRTDDLRLELAYRWPLIRRDLLQEEAQAARSGSLASLLRDRASLSDVFDAVRELLLSSGDAPKLQQVGADLVKLGTGLPLREDTSVRARGIAAAGLGSENTSPN